MITSPIMIIVALALIVAEVGWLGLIGVVALFVGTMLSGKIGYM